MTIRIQRQDPLPTLPIKKVFIVSDGGSGSQLELTPDRDGFLKIMPQMSSHTAQLSLRKHSIDQLIDALVELKEQVK